MNDFNYNHADELCVEDVTVSSIVKTFGTPLYIYSRKSFERQYSAFDAAFATHSHQVCYAVKANSNIAILNCLAKLGAGFDIVSQGELERVLLAGGDPRKIIFSGIGKLESEIERALQVGIACFNVESLRELHRINDIAKRHHKKAPIAFRVNPNIDAGTHPYITTGLKHNKFGISTQRTIEFYQTAFAMEHIEIKGIAFHIGSQILELTPFREAMTAILGLMAELKALGIHLQHLDIGGGMGVRYHNENAPQAKDYASYILSEMDDQDLKIYLEPGRAIIANAGILVTRVEYLKHTPYHDFAIVDAGMNDLIRPSLYQAYHDIIPVTRHQHTEASKEYDIVGPVCESGDFLGKKRELSLRSGDLLAVCSAGAYGSCMSSNYNSRVKPAEVLVDDDKIHLIRRREKLEDLWAHESLVEE